MNYFKAIIISAFFSLAAIGAGVFYVTPAHAATCTDVTTKDLNQITVIQNDPTLSYSDELTKELALRKALINKTIDCAQQDVQTLQANLQAATVDSSSKGLQSQLAGKLNDASNFYTIEQTKLGTTGIAGSQAVAKELLDWRTANFLPLSEDVNNFILWSQNQSLFNTAQSRMDQTQRAVSFLESAAPNADLQNALDSAMTSFTDAQNENAAAKTALAQSLPPDQSLSLIKQSLDSLSATYQGFFTVSTIISGILPQ